MKRTLLTVMICALAGLGRAQLVTNLFSPVASLPVAIPAGNPVGVTETFNVSGVGGAIADVQVSLDITGGFNGDLYAYLVGPDGTLSVLLNRVGVTAGNAYGYGDAGMNITLDGAAVNNIHDYGNTMGYSLSGTTWAADGRNVDPQSPGATLDGTATTDGLNVFNGDMNTDGTWTLFIADMVGGGGTAELNSVGLTIMTAPEPQTWVMAGSGLALLIAIRRSKSVS